MPNTNRPPRRAPWLAGLLGVLAWASCGVSRSGPLSPADEQFTDARVDWRYWTAPELSGSLPLLRHGKTRDGRFLGCCWDRLNGETVFMYLLAAGADPERHR